MDVDRHVIKDHNAKISLPFATSKDQLADDLTRVVSGKGVSKLAGQVENDQRFFTNFEGESWCEQQEKYSIINYFQNCVNLQPYYSENCVNILFNLLFL